MHDNDRIPVTDDDWDNEEDYEDEEAEVTCSCGADCPSDEGDHMSWCDIWDQEDQDQDEEYDEYEYDEEIPRDLCLNATGPFFPAGRTYLDGMPPVTSPIRAAELRRQAWRCPECKSGNDGSRTTCRTCRKEKP